MVRKTKISKTFCKMLIFVCVVAILYSLARSFLFPSREGLDNPGLTDFVTGAGRGIARDKKACKKPEGWCVHNTAKPTFKECGGKKGWWCEDATNNKGFISCDHKPGDPFPYFGPDGKCLAAASLPKVCMNSNAWAQASTDSGCSWDVDVNDKNSCNTFQKGVCLEQCKGIWCNPDPKANPDPKCDKTNKAWCQGVGFGGTSF